MKRILITGANSYIGTSLEKYLDTQEYYIDTLDMIDGSWRNKLFTGFDSIFHVAGIAHIKETKENRDLYYKINRDLAFDVAQKAKEEGVGQFIYLSSMSVYGMDTGIITKNTIPKPTSNYGKSKIQAEEKLSTLSNPKFNLCFLRPPMVYGKDCRGNFQSVIRLIKKYPVFPKINNRRSMIHIDNLCSFVKLCIDEKLNGIYFPQNREYMSTSLMAKWLAEEMEKKIYMSSIMGCGIMLMMPFIKMVKKAFGNLIYKDTEDFGYKYCVIENQDSVRKSI